MKVPLETDRHRMVRLMKASRPSDLHSALRPVRVDEAWFVSRAAARVRRCSHRTVIPLLRMAIDVWTVEAEVICLVGGLSLSGLWDTRSAEFLTHMWRAEATLHWLI